MKKLIAAAAIFGVICMAGVASGEQKLEDVVQAAKAKVKITKSYELGTTANEPVCEYKDEIKTYVSFLMGDHPTPTDYVLGLFDKYDIVILCERRHDEMTQYELIFDIVSDPRFTGQGGHIFTEIGTSSIRDRVREFLHASDLDEEEATSRLLQIYRQLDFFPVWPKYNMYDFLMRLHQLNKSLPQAQKINLYPSNMPFTWEGMTEEKHREFWRTLEMRDKVMAEQIIRTYNEILRSQNQRKKALVIMNFGHAFNDCEFADGKKGDHVGRYLFEKYPDRVANVIINSMALSPGGTTAKPRPSYAPVQNGKWDAAFAAIGNPDLGFDLEASPFGEDHFDFLSVDAKQFRAQNLTYEDVFTGFVFYRPLQEHIVGYGIPGLMGEGFMSDLVERFKISSGSSEVEDEFVRRLERLNELSESPYTDHRGKKLDFQEIIGQWLLK